VTDALELAGDRSFWRQIATAGCYGWSLRAMMMMMMVMGQEQIWGSCHLNPPRLRPVHLVILCARRRDLLVFVNLQRPVHAQELLLTSW